MSRCKKFIEEAAITDNFEKAQVHKKLLETKSLMEKIPDFKPMVKPMDVMVKNASKIAFGGVSRVVRVPRRKSNGSK